LFGISNLGHWDLFEIWILVIGIFIIFIDSGLGQGFRILEFRFVRVRLSRHHRLNGVRADCSHAIAYFPEHRFISINTDNGAA